MSVSIFVEGDFAGEVAVDEDEVADGQRDAEEPPDQADFQAVVRRFGGGDRQRIDGIASGQHHRVQAEDNAGEHAGEIGGGREEGLVLVAFDDFELHAGEAGDGEQRENQAPRPGGEIGFELRLNLEGDRSDDGGECGDGPPNPAGESSGALADRAGGLELDPQRSVHDKSEQGKNTNQNRVPIEDAGFLTDGEVGPERLEEIAGGVERDAADHVGERGAEKHGEQQAGSAEKKIPDRLPHGAVKVIAKFDGDAAQDQEPENHHEWEIEAAEARWRKGRGRQNRACRRGEEPDFVAIPDGADAGEDLAAFVVGLCDEEMDGAGAEIEAVEQDVRGDHQGDETEPDCAHVRHSPQSAAIATIFAAVRVSSGSGPSSISR